jgi:signal transduction histidine kinase/HAMP domain-containing protein
MQRFSQRPIRTKLIQLVVTTCGIVLLLAMLVLIVVEAVSIRRSMARSVGTLAQAVAFNSTAALAFDDPADAEQVLQALRADPFVHYAALFTAQGELFAQYPADADPVDVPEALRAEGGQEFGGGYFHFYQPVLDRGTSWGTLYIRYNLRLLKDRLLFDFFVAIFVLAGAVGASYLIASIIQRSISGPIISLAEVARLISREHDFDIRAPKLSADEIGDLTDAFNEMLNELGQKEVALRRSEERLRLALSSSQTGIWDLNLETDEIEMEGHVFRLMGENTPRMYFSSLIEQYVHPADRKRLEAANRRAVEQEQPLDITYRVILPGNEVRHYYSRGQIRPKQEGAPAHMLGVTIDVTATREAEQEILRLNRELEQRVLERTAELRNALHEIESFSYSVSHDLRAPLRSIDGFSKILLSDYEANLDEEGRDFLRRIRQSSQKMGQLIEDMLMLSRVTRQEMKRQPVDLSALAREIFLDLQRPDQEREVALKVEPGLWAFGDENLIRIALQNLLGNAWKFTSRQGDALIELGARRQEGERVFFVRDNGAGFDMQHGKKLFGAFQRLHGVTEFEGTGIGLATVKRIINRHGGAIWAEAAVNQGATFFFTLPDPTEDEPEKRDIAGGRQSG